METDHARACTTSWKEGWNRVTSTTTVFEAGGGQALEGWVQRYQPELQRHLTRMLGSCTDAEDVLQQVWVTAMRRPPDDGPGSNVRAWLYRVATNRALDCLAGARRRRKALTVQDPGLATGETRPPDEGAYALTAAARDRIRAHCTRLPRKQREAVWMRWVDGLDYETIAERLGSSTDSARANVYHGMKRLRAELQDLWTKEYGP